MRVRCHGIVVVRVFHQTILLMGVGWQWVVVDWQWVVVFLWCVQQVVRVSHQTILIVSVPSNSGGGHLLLNLLPITTPQTVVVLYHKPGGSTQCGNLREISD